MDSSGWTNFWEDQKQSFSEVMVINTHFFALQLEKQFALKPTDEILDYGCGPGFLADYLSSKNIFIVGADINNYFIEQSRKNHSKSLFIHITTDVVLNRKLLDTQLKGKKFDFIILLSVTQYLKDVDALDILVSMLLSYNKENGKIIIADVVDVDTSTIQDVLSLFVHCVKKGKIIAFFRFTFYLVFSSYRKLSKNVNLLKLSEQSIKKIANNNFLSYKKMNGLTIHSSRTNYVLIRKSAI